MPSPKSKTKPSRTPKKPAQPQAEWTFSAIGTEWWIGVYESVDPAALALLQQKVNQRIELFDKTYSRFRGDSLVTQLAQSAGSYTFPTDCKPLFRFYEQLYEITDGLVTPLIGQTLANAGYDATYSLQSGHISAPPKWKDVLNLYNQTLTATQPVLLDFGAAGKGYLVDILSELLHGAGVVRFCIDASGDLYCSQLAEPLRIGLENPQNVAQAIGIVSMQNGALCGSAGNRRAWGKYHHILNPHTLEPVQDIQAVWVSAETTMLADGLATALFFVPAEQLQKHFRFAHCIVQADNTVQCSADFPAELFT